MNERNSNVTTNKTTLYRAALKAGVATALLASATPAMAQETAQASEAVETIVVTGSRIARPDLDSVSPVTVLGAEEIKFQGVTRTEDLINNLPQAFAGQGSNLANGATGTATINLRGLGSSRTMVLINGRRLMPGDPAQASPVPDINFIPSTIVKRVDVLTGGASSVYGSDAVAGVVNFVMDTEFEGVQVDSQYSFYQHNNSNGTVQSLLKLRNFAVPDGNTTDGGTFDTTMSFGGKIAEGRGHFMAYVGYRKANKVTQGDRDYSACAVNGSSANSTGLVCAGSATSANGTFFTDYSVGVDDPETVDDPLTLDIDEGNDIGTRGGDVLQIGSGRVFSPGSTAFNYAPYNYFQRPDKRITAGAFAHYEINEHFVPYMEFMFMDDRTKAVIAPSGNFGNTYSINCDSPLMSAQQAAIVCDDGSVSGFNNLVGFSYDNPTTPEDESSPATVFIDQDGNPYNRGNLQVLRRNVEGGGRVADLRHTDYRIVAGSRGIIDDTWSYDVYGQFSSVVYQQVYLNDMSITRLTRALDVVTDPDTGLPVCRSVLDGSDTNCVPYDIFTPGGVTSEAITYLQTPGLLKGETKQTIVSGSVSGNLGDYGFKTPWAGEGVGVAFGAEYRKEQLELRPDTAFESGDLSGQGGATTGVGGSYSVKELFAEARIPLVQDAPFAEELSLELGYRYSDYTSAGTTDTYKVQAEWAPVRDVRFRGGYNRAVRAPNVVELYSTQSVALDGSTDPCAGTLAELAAAGVTQAMCARTGVSAAQFGSIIANPASQYNGLLGGNPDLKPEKSDTYTLGMVLAPAFLPNFSATVDWFSINIKDQIGVIGADLILEQCMATGDEALCSLINRDSFGSLWRSSDGYVVDTNLNAGKIKTRGIDVNLNYAYNTDNWGGFRFNVVGTWLDLLKTTPAVGDAYDCVGKFGTTCGTPSPEWRHKARVTWATTIGLDVSLSWRYFSKVKLDTTTNFEANRKISAQNYFDLAFNFQASDKLKLRAGVNNLFDRDPPIVGGQVLTPVFGSGNTFPQVYDSMGRYIFMGGTVNF